MAKEINMIGYGVQKGNPSKQGLKHTMLDVNVFAHLVQKGNPSKQGLKLHHEDLPRWIYTSPKR